MSERLRHLQRQQALLREHLAWIESEIVKETPETLSPSIGSTAPVVMSVRAAQVIPATADADADALIERYAANERQNPRDVRRGCLILFSAALFVLVGGVVAVWLLHYR
jgi:hypothetical protein